MHSYIHIYVCKQPCTTLKQCVTKWLTILYFNAPPSAKRGGTVKLSKNTIRLFPDTWSLLYRREMCHSCLHLCVCARVCVARRNTCFVSFLRAHPKVASHSTHLQNRYDTPMSDTLTAFRSWWPLLYWFQPSNPVDSINICRYVLTERAWEAIFILTRRITCVCTDLHIYMRLQTFTGPIIIQAVCVCVCACARVYNVMSHLSWIYLKFILNSW
jgi:hypothetical protein